MSAGRGIATGVIIMVAAILLVFPCLLAQRKMRAAEAMTVSFVDPDYVRAEVTRTGKVPDDAKVNIEVVGPNRRAADSARTRRNTLCGLCVSIAVLGVGTMIVGLAGRRRRDSDAK